jgi:hypothetical protein
MRIIRCRVKVKVTATECKSPLANLSDPVAVLLTKLTLRNLGRTCNFRDVGMLTIRQGNSQMQLTVSSACGV